MSNKGYLLPLFGLLLLSACDDGQSSALTGVRPNEAAAPNGSQPLLSMPEEVARDTAVWATSEIPYWRAEGLRQMVEALKASLTQRGLDPALLDPITPESIGQPLPAHVNRSGSVGSTSSAISWQRSALGEPGDDQYYECPLDAPEDASGTRCADMVDEVVALVSAAIEEQKAEMASYVAQEYASLEQTAQDFIEAWAQTAKEFGAEIAAVYARQYLMAAGVCDVQENSAVIAYRLGVDQGIDIVLELKAWAISQVNACMVNIDRITEQVQIQATGKIDAFMEEHAICVDRDVSRLNQGLQDAEVQRRLGIVQGIEDQVKVLRQELHELRQTIPCGECVLGEDGALEPLPDDQAEDCNVNAACNIIPSPVEDHPRGQKLIGNRCYCCKIRRNHQAVCKGMNDGSLYCLQQSARVEDWNDDAWANPVCGCDEVQLGSPLVLDLDDDGVTLTEEMVRFDLLASGSTPRTHWVGPREGLLALDLDGDGEIGSGAELFGNHTDCGGKRCYDGVEALRQWDTPARGGNGDGMIDDKDAVWSRLRLWIDGDTDGKSQGETQAMASAGIRAINLDASYDVQRRRLGSITAQLGVLTDKGFRTAHDVWFKLRPTVKDLGDL